MLYHKHKWYQDNLDIKNQFQLIHKLMKEVKEDRNMKMKINQH